MFKKNSISNYDSDTVSFYFIKICFFFVNKIKKKKIVINYNIIKVSVIKRLRK